MDELEQRLQATLRDERLQVLPRHDALDLIRTGVRRRRRRARVTAAASGLAAVVVAVVASLTVPGLLHGPARTRQPQLTPLSRTWQIASTTALPTDVSDVTALSVAAGHIWLGVQGQLLRVDPGTGVVDRYAEPGTADSIAATPRHVWAAVVAGSSCLVDERDAATGLHVLAHRLPCASRARLSVTANGDRAWVLVRDAREVRLHLLTAGAAAETRSQQVLGASRGSQPLAIGGALVYVLGGGSSAPIVTVFGSDRLTRPTTVSVPAGVDRLAYGEHRLVLAGPGGEWWLDPQSLQAHRIASGAARDLTTGNSLIWTVTGAAPSRLVVRDPVTGREVGLVVVEGTVSHVVAIGTDLWAAVTRSDGTAAVVRVAPAGAG